MHSRHSNGSDRSPEHISLLSQNDSSPGYGAAEADTEEGDEARPLLQSSAAASLRSLQNPLKKGGRRWPTIAAVTILGIAIIAIILGAFFAPTVLEEYAKEAVVIEPTSLSIHEFTSKGVIARVQVNFHMDAKRVKNKDIRNIGRFGTWLARKVQSEKSIVEVYLPEYGNILLGTAAVPSIVVDIRNGHTTSIDFLADLEPGDVKGIKQMANEWLGGRLANVRVTGKATVALKSGLLHLGSQHISESLVLKGNDIPSVPEYNITRLNIHEVPVSANGRRGMGADVSITVANSYPIGLIIPPLSFDILVSNCGQQDPYIRLADATTGVITIEPYKYVNVDVGGIVRDLPQSLLQTCPNSKSSPLDLLLADYIHGNDTTIFVRGSSLPSPETPEWVSAIMSSITIPVPFPGRTFDKLIKSFTLTDSKFHFPSFFADPDEEPAVSGNVVVIAGLPKEMNFGVNITRVRASADVLYRKEKLGVLDLKKWQNATSERIEPKDGGAALLKIQSRIEKAPLHITDDAVLQKLVLKYVSGDRIDLKVAALVDVEIVTVLGKLVVKELPAEGLVPVNAISNGTSFASLKPQVGDLKILSTSRTSLNLQARVNFTNPTVYSAEVGYVNIHILNNGSIIGDATARNIIVKPGNNTDILVEATWDPASFGGKRAAAIGRELLSQYVSGYNTTLSFQTHEKTFPNEPNIGKALKDFTITVPAPRFSSPSNDPPDGEDDNRPHFIKDATFHVFTSTAQFTLLSPLKYSTLFVEEINATALYNHTEPVGTIDYDLPFKVPPGASQSPKLPVEWSVGSVGYDALKSALGGTLKLDAKGTVGIRLGQFKETIWYAGSGIGASIRF
ncbi:hypothetical protein B0O99DRAFT_499900 [Bisporella sp. PMI_857]|nr:hypothetical protein B0O99DRAFT_499900 [Bisporella sp. PMI_857]